MLKMVFKVMSRYSKKNSIATVSEYPFKQKKNTIKKHKSAIIYTFL